MEWILGKYGIQFQYGMRWRKLCSYLGWHGIFRISRRSSRRIVLINLTAYFWVNPFDFWTGSSKIDLIIETSKGCVCLPGHIRHPDGRCIWYEAWCSTLFWENNGDCGENEFYTDCKHDNGHAFEIIQFACSADCSIDCIIAFTNACSIACIIASIIACMIAWSIALIIACSVLCLISTAKKVIVVMELIFALNQKISMVPNVNLVVNAVMGTTETLLMVSHNQWLIGHRNNRSF